MRDSEIVLALADIASRGKYEVTPSGAKHMNSIFDMVAGLINRLEEGEANNEDSE